MMIVLLPSATKREKPWNVGRDGKNIDIVIKDTWNNFIKKGKNFDELTKILGKDLECDCRNPPFRPINEVFIKDYQGFVFDLENWKTDDCLNKEKDLLNEYAQVLKKEKDSFLVLCVSNIRELEMSDLGIPKEFVYKSMVNNENYEEVIYNYLYFVIDLYLKSQDPERMLVTKETLKRDKETMDSKYDMAYV